VLHSEAGKDLDAAIVHHDGEVHDYFTGWRPENAPQAFIEIELAGSEFETSALCLPGIDFLVKGDGWRYCHTYFSPNPIPDAGLGNGDDPAVVSSRPTDRRNRFSSVSTEGAFCGPDVDSMQAGSLGPQRTAVQPKPQ
jgi:hypothetical protein